jgi:hypothetical protein
LNQRSSRYRRCGNTQRCARVDRCGHARDRLRFARQERLAGRIAAVRCAQARGVEVAGCVIVRLALRRAGQADDGKNAPPRITC